MLRRAASYVFENFYTLLTRVPLAVAIVAVGAIIIHGLTEHVTVISSLSVPKSLSDSGYTPEVASNRLRDALQDFVKSVNTRMKSPDIAMHGELPDIVVPSVGISLDAIMSSIRTMLRSTRSRTIAGEFTVVHDQLWLRLRLDGREIYTSDKGVDPGAPDELLKAAAPKVLLQIQPYFVAASLSTTNVDAALAMADDIISRLPERDENVAWSYNLKGTLLLQRKEFDAASSALNEAIRINPNLAVAHINLGNIMKEQDHPDEAMEQYNAAIAIEPTDAMAHYDLGVTLRELGKTDKAIEQYRLAIKFNPKDALAHDYLGHALRSEKKNDEAISEFSKAIEIDQQYAMAHYNLADVLCEVRQWDRAVKEYQAAIAADPKFAAAHNGLAEALRGQGQVDDAVMEYQEAIKVEPRYVTARSNLAIVYVGRGQFADAIAEFQTVLGIEPRNSIALMYLKQLGENVTVDETAGADARSVRSNFSSKLQYPD